jgi:hypothetical protein
VNQFVNASDVNIPLGRPCMTDEIAKGVSLPVQSASLAHPPTITSAPGVDGNDLLTGKQVRRNTRLSCGPKP